MLGPVPEARCSTSSLVQAYRAHGLFRRWPIDYLATHGDGGLARNAMLMASALHRFVGLIAGGRGLLVHLHVAARGALWQEALFMVLALAVRCPVILHLHGNGVERLYARSGRPLRALIRFMLEETACIVVPCEAQRTWMRGVTRLAHVSVVPYPMSPPPAQDASHARRVLYLGRLDGERGVYDLLEAVSAVRRAVPDVCLVCAGEGERAAIERYAERLGIADAVKFTGWVGPSGKRVLLESAAVCALPSSDEAMPISLLEAMAAGVPTIAAPAGDALEHLVDGVSGFLIAPGDTMALQRLLRKLLLDPKLAARVGAAARESVRLRCAPDRVLARLGNLYAELGLCAFAEAPVQAAH
jgi:glycosyltransferase involved in cell wall biosynthesis